MPNRRQALIWTNDVIFDFSEPIFWTKYHFRFFMHEMYVQVFMASIHKKSVVIGNLHEYSIHDGNATTVPKCYHMMTHVLDPRWNYSLASGTTCDLWLKKSLHRIMHVYFPRKRVRCSTHFISGIFPRYYYILNVWLRMYFTLWLWLM